MAWIDIVYIGIIVVFAIIGLAKGLFDSILSLIASVASVFLAFWASKPVAAFLNKIADVNGFFEQFLVSNMGVPETGAAGQTLSELASVCTLALSVLIVFVLIKIAVWLLAKLFDSVSAQSTPGSGMDRLLGLVFGAAKGFAVVLVALGVTSIFSMVPAFEANIDSFLNNSSITRGTYIYVDEWVENELEDKLDDFVRDLADYAEVPEEPQAKNYAEEVQKTLDTNGYAVVEGDTVTITVETSKAYVSEDPAEQNITVNIQWPTAALIKQGETVVKTGIISNGVVVVEGLAAGEYTVVFENVKFTFGTEGDEGYCEKIANVQFTITVA